MMTEADQDEQFYRDTESIAFPKLDDRQLAMLEPLGGDGDSRPGHQQDGGNKNWRKRAGSECPLSWLIRCGFSL